MKHDGKRVLIVEDELLVAMEMEDVLLRRGFIVTDIASTVEQALEAIRQEQPDVVMLDLNLQGIPTIPVAEELNRRGTPFAVVTGYQKQAQNDPALQQAPLVLKPWNEATILQALEQAVAAPPCT